MSSAKIPLSSPDVTEAEIEAVAETLRSPQLSLGPRLTEFEATFTDLTGVEHAVAVSSGTAGLHLAMLALGIGAGDEVIVPSFTFIAAANAIRYVGATPVFVDIDCVTLNLSPAAVEQAINSRTRAIVAVHTFGVPADMPALAELARRPPSVLVEDACEALGATMHSQPVGSFGDVAVFAFYPNKQITTGEGGMIVTRDRCACREDAKLAKPGTGADRQLAATHGDWLSTIGFPRSRAPLESARCGGLRASSTDASRLRECIASTLARKVTSRFRSTRYQAAASAGSSMLSVLRTRLQPRIATR